jgi:hypothetical protein
MVKVIKPTTHTLVKNKVLQKDTTPQQDSTAAPTAIAATAAPATGLYALTTDTNGHFTKREASVQNKIGTNWLYMKEDRDYDLNTAQAWAVKRLYTLMRMSEDACILRNKRSSEVHRCTPAEFTAMFIHVDDSMLEFLNKEAAYAEETVQKLEIRNYYPKAHENTTKEFVLFYSADGCRNMVLLRGDIVLYKGHLAFIKDVSLVYHQGYNAKIQINYVGNWRIDEEEVMHMTKKVSYGTPSTLRFVRRAGSKHNFKEEPAEEGTTPFYYLRNASYWSRRIKVGDKIKVNKNVKFSHYGKYVVKEVSSYDEYGMLVEDVHEYEYEKGKKYKMEYFASVFDVEERCWR